MPMNPAYDTAIPYKIIATCFRDRSVVPFLGAAASFVGAPKESSLPSGAELAKLLRDLHPYPGSLSDPLTKVAQYLEEIPADRSLLLNTVQRYFLEQVPSGYETSLTEFLGSIPPALMPEMVLTTNYDILVEGALERRAVPYMAISHVMKGSKYANRLLCYESVRTPLTTSNIQPLKQVENRLSELGRRGPLPVLVYKMHGTARLHCDGSTVDSVVLTENDYIDFFVQKTLDRIPAKILELLRTKRLLFLGYGLEDWNFRVLLGKLQHIQRQKGDSMRHWAILLGADDVEVKFWERRGVNLYAQSLDVFLSNLGKELW